MPVIKPKPYTGKEPDLIGFWPLSVKKGQIDWKDKSKSKLTTEVKMCPENLDEIKTPWGGQAAIFNGKAGFRVNQVSPLPVKQFTAEAWVYWQDLPREQQTIIELSNKESISWRLSLNRHTALEFSWQDNAGKSDIVKSFQLCDIIIPKRWFHVALVFRNVYNPDPSCSYSVNYSIVKLYFTGEGQLFPRILAVKRTFKEPYVSDIPASFFIGTDRYSRHPFKGALSTVAVTNRVKLKNEFPTLGQSPPSDIKISSRFPGGSSFYPVRKQRNSVVVGCSPAAAFSIGNYWFYGRIDGCRNKKMDFELLTAPGGQAMLVAAWLSYDKKNWQRINNSYYVNDTSMSPEQGSLSFSHKFNKSPVWIAASVPYMNEDVDRLCKACEKSPLVKIIKGSESVEKRPVRIFKVTDPSVDDNNKKAVYIQAGQHSPMEMMAGRSCDRAIRYLISGDEHALSVLKKAVFFFVPIVNVDCAYNGGGGANAHNENLNCHWRKLGEPESRGLKKFIDGLVKEGSSLSLAIDFHAGGCFQNHVVMSILEEFSRKITPDYYAKQERFIDCLDKYTDIAKADIIKRKQMPNSFSGTMHEEYKVLSFVIELSAVTYRRVEDGLCYPVTQAHIENLGIQLIKAIENYLFPDF